MVSSSPVSKLLPEENGSRSLKTCGYQDNHGLKDSSAKGIPRNEIGQVSGKTWLSVLFGEKKQMEKEKI